MICSSLNLLRFIRPSLAGADSTEKWRHFRGARQPWWFHPSPAVSCADALTNLRYQHKVKFSTVVQCAP
jgi:hypothetical protein